MAVRVVWMRMSAVGDPGPGAPGVMRKLPPCWCPVGHRAYINRLLRAPALAMALRIGIYVGSVLVDGNPSETRKLQSRMCAPLWDRGFGQHGPCNMAGPRPLRELQLAAGGAARP